MKRLRFNPFFAVTADTGATSATATQSIYIPNIDSKQNVTGKLVATGTWNSATLNVKFEDSADDVTYADVTGGAFTAVTADTPAGGQVLSFSLAPSNMAQNTGVYNYGKYLRCEWVTTGGTASDIDIYVVLEGIGLTDDDIELRLEPLPIP